MPEFNELENKLPNWGKEVAKLLLFFGFGRCRVTFGYCSCHRASTHNSSAGARRAPYSTFEPACSSRDPRRTIFESSRCEKRALHSAGASLIGAVKYRLALPFCQPVPEILGKGSFSVGRSVRPHETHNERIHLTKRVRNSGMRALCQN